MEVVVIKNYQAAYPDALVLKTGDRLAIIPKESEWPGWLWCKSEENNHGWVPQSYIDISDNVGTVLRDYSTVELTVNTGDILTVIEEESGWLLCRDMQNNTGWVPKENTGLCD